MYLCVCVCVSYCQQYNWSHGRPVLVRPYDTMFMSYESMSDGDEVTAAHVTDWLTTRLSEHIHNISSLEELQHDWLDLSSNTRHTQPVSVVICLSDPMTMSDAVTTPQTTTSVPLLLAVLSVVMQGRVRFAQVTQSIASQAVSLADQQLVVVISTAETTYVYGSGDADCMTLAGLRLLLSLVAPSAADLLDVCITVSLLLLCLQPCLVYSTVNSRLLSLVTFSLQLSLLSLLYCFFVSYVIAEHELQPLIDHLLPAWRYVMLTSFGDLVRSDWLRYTTVNFSSFVVTYFVYLLLVGWFYGHLCRQKKTCLMTYLSSVVDEDQDKEYIDWYTWQQFGEPDFWLELRERETLSADVSDSCAGCRQRLSYGSKVCRSACQHVFHRHCLARLIYTHQYLCPACHCPLYTDTYTDTASHCNLSTLTTDHTDH